MDRPHPYKHVCTSNFRRGRGTERGYLCEWGGVVGDRIRRLRRDRGLTLADLAHSIPKPEGGHFSPGYISRIERGWTSATLYAYLAIAAALDVDPGSLLGPDAASLETDTAEAVLLRWMRARGVAPHDALLRLSADSSDRSAMTT